MKYPKRALLLACRKILFEQGKHDESTKLYAYIARQSGVSQQHIWAQLNRPEGGTVDDIYLPRYADALGVTVDELKENITEAERMERR